MLKEQVENIKNRTIALSSKKRAIVRCGISANIASLFLSDLDEKFEAQTDERLNEIIEILTSSLHAANEKARAREIERERRIEADRQTALINNPDSIFNTLNYTFGVEIECVNAPRERLIEYATQRGVNIESESYNHNDTRTHFKIVRDGSLQGVNSNEIVSPILSGVEGLEQLKNICTALTATGAKINKSCGLHIHVGAANFTDQHKKNIFLNYMRCEVAIDNFMAVSRRGNNNPFARSLNGWRSVLANETSTFASFVGTCSNRYLKVNPRAYTRHKTIEFRQHQGTIEYNKILHWLRFIFLLVAYSEHHVIEDNINSIAELPFVTDELKQYYTLRASRLNRHLND